MRDDLAGRYVWAVARQLPASMRDDVSEELRATIEDMAADRGSEEAVREVLLELGDPSVLAARYSGARRHLIGPAVYDDYVRLLKALAVTVLPAVLVAFLVVRFWDPEQAVVPGILSAVGSTAGVAIQIAFWATLVFAIIERTSTGVEALRATDGREWRPEQLPAVPGPRQIGLGDTVASVVLLAAIPVFLVLQHVRSAVEDRSGEPVPLLDPDLWRAWLPVLLGLVVAGVALEIWKYREGRWTRRVTVANVLLDLALLAYLFALVTVADVVNPAWAAALREQGSDVDPAAAVVVTVVIIAAVVVWDAVEGVVKHVRAAAPGDDTAAPVMEPGRSG